MGIDPYDDILKRTAELSPEELLRLSDELSRRACRKNGGEQPSILDLEGLGKEIWEGIDPDEYVAKERDSWGGLSHSSQS